MIHEPRPHNRDNVDEVDQRPSHEHPPDPLFNPPISRSALDLLRTAEPLDLLTAWWRLQALNLDPHSIDRLRLSNTFESIEANTDITCSFRGEAIDSALMCLNASSVRST